MADKAPLPAWIAENNDGSASITLRKPLDIDGTKMPKLTMREPLVDDQLIMDATNGSAAVKEMTMIANLCGISIADVKRLTTRDYGRAQDAFAVFRD